MRLKASMFFLICGLVHCGRLKRSMLDEDPCEDAREVTTPDTIHFPARYGNLSRPWMRDDTRPHVYTSVGLQYQWFWVESLPVRGITSSTTIGDIIRWLDSLNCTFIATGESAWQTLQRAKPLAISGETSCSIDKLHELCVRKFSAQSCGLYPIEDGGWGAYWLEIGDSRTNASIDELRAEPLKLFDWGETLKKKPAEWGYTMDPIAIYDNQAGQVYLIDLSGRGYQDLCEKKISPAVNAEKWKEWGEGKVNKMLQFYKLRWQGLSPSNHDFACLVNQLIEQKLTRKDTETFYCESLLGGVVNYAGDGMVTTCHVVYPDTAQVKKIAQAKEILANELGPIYTSKMQEAIDKMEAIFLTPQQFVDTRNRLKHRISTPSQRPTHPPRILGEPLVQDISENATSLTTTQSQVHKRPILSKSEAITDLPPDYPSSFNVHPNQNGDFQEGYYNLEGGGAPPEIPVHPDRQISNFAEELHSLYDGDSEEEEDDDDDDDDENDSSTLTGSHQKHTSSKAVLFPALGLTVLVFCSTFL